MRGYTDSDVAAREHAPVAVWATEGASKDEPLPPELIEVERPSVETVLEIRTAAARWAAYQADPTVEEKDAAFDWHRALEQLTPQTVFDLCDVWLLVEAENVADDFDRGEA